MFCFIDKAYTYTKQLLYFYACDWPPEQSDNMHHIYHSPYPKTIDFNMKAAIYQEFYTIPETLCDTISRKQKAQFFKLFLLPESMYVLYKSKQKANLEKPNYTIKNIIQQGSLLLLIEM